MFAILADLFGTRDGTEAPFEERRFIDVFAENFDTVMQSLKPRLEFQVKNRLPGGGDLPIQLTFESMRDFEPRADCPKD